MTNSPSLNCTEFSSHSPLFKIVLVAFLIHILYAPRAILESSTCEKQACGRIFLPLSHHVPPIGPQFHLQVQLCYGLSREKLLVPLTLQFGSCFKQLPPRKTSRTFAYTSYHRDHRKFAKTNLQHKGAIKMEDKRDLANFRADVAKKARLRRIQQ